jgi:hypothetical protein
VGGGLQGHPARGGDVAAVAHPEGVPVQAPDAAVAVAPGDARPEDQFLVGVPIGPGRVDLREHRSQPLPRIPGGAGQFLVILPQEIGGRRTDVHLLVLGDPDGAGGRTAGGWAGGGRALGVPVVLPLLRRLRMSRRASGQRLRALRP